VYAFLISDGTRPGSSRLASALAEVFELHLIPPVFVTQSDIEDMGLVNKPAFLAYHLRLPTTGEVGCALAHRGAQERMIELNLHSAAVFEDDAQIRDTLDLANRLGTYESMCSQPTPTLVNINRNAIPKRLQTRAVSAVGVHEALTPPYPATAYVLNIGAARAFTSAQIPIRSQADWPRTSTKVRYFVDRLSPVSEDQTIDSRIDTAESRLAVPALRKASMWTGLWYRKHRYEFPTWHHFWSWHPRARIIHHADGILQRFASRTGR